MIGYRSNRALRDFRMQTLLFRNTLDLQCAPAPNITQGRLVAGTKLGGEEAFYGRVFAEWGCKRSGGELDVDLRKLWRR